MKPIIPIYLVDAFAPEPYQGNPAAVCFLQQEMTTEWMQKVAAEMNQAETAFLLEKKGIFSLRWFTPLTEVELCGHATLASAHILYETQVAPDDEVLRFETLSGILSAQKSGGQIELDFPSEPAHAFDIPAELLQALGAPAKFTGRNRFDYLIEVEDENILRSLKPDFQSLAKAGIRGFIVTAPSASGNYDFVSRFFAPGVGIPEDPATGSAHCCLGPYWMEKLGKKILKGWQASARGAEIEVEVKGQRALLRGSAFTVMQGVLVNGF